MADDQRKFEKPYNYVRFLAIDLKKQVILSIVSKSLYLLLTQKLDREGELTNSPLGKPSISIGHKL